MPTSGTAEQYEQFLTSRCRKQWERIGVKRRAGVAVPLFSIYSANSIGIGELPDLNLLVDWCQAAGLSVIQLLPMNDVGFDFRPYDAQSSFALDPMYLSIQKLHETDVKPFQKEPGELKKKFPAGGGRVNYQIKKAKLELFWKIFQKNLEKLPPHFEEYQHQNRYWLEDYALFKVLKEINDEQGWEAWPTEQKHKNTDAMQEIHLNHVDRIQFFKWLQWQLYLQFQEAKKYAASKNVLILGDLPLLVSRDSADVWAHQSYFKLDLSSGAPPDLYFAKGQRWGMPPYNWHHIATHGYDYLISKLKYAEHFYDCFRIDHVVGIFRIWTIPLSEPPENHGLHGHFDPRDEHLWEEHGRRLLQVMAENTQMLPCAEDLGVVPACSWKVLEEFGIPGIDVQRWSRDWNRTFDFKAPEAYRKNSIANISTHDMAVLQAWWEYEAGTVDEILFKRMCQGRVSHAEKIIPELFDLARSKHGRLRWRPEISSVGALLEKLQIPESHARDFLDLHKGTIDEKKRFWHFLGMPGEPTATCSAAFIRRTLEKISATTSVFSIQLIQDWLSLGNLLPGDPWNWRINFPGTMSDQNWSLVLPLPLEKLLSLPLNSVIKTMNAQSGRL